MENWQEITIRVILAIAFGALIGIEREHRDRPAGFKTHILVMLGSTLLTMVGISGFSPKMDSRVAAQIVSGIGFLGAGTIMKNGNTIIGLSTAASLWVSAGIGMALGTGLYFPAALVTIAAFLVLKFGGRIDQAVLPLYQESWIIAGNIDAQGYLEIINELERYNIQVVSSQVTKGTSPEEKSPKDGSVPEVSPATGRKQDWKKTVMDAFIPRILPKDGKNDRQEMRMTESQQEDLAPNEETVPMFDKTTPRSADALDFSEMIKTSALSVTEISLTVVTEKQEDLNKVYHFLTLLSGVQKLSREGIRLKEGRE